MFKQIFKYIFTYKVINLFFKIYIKFIEILPKYSSSEKYWKLNTVNAPSNIFYNIKESIKHLNWRNSQYLNCAENMKYNNAHKKIVLDYGCGPGNGIINLITKCKPKKIIAVDVSEKAINLATKRAYLHRIKVDFIKINENEKISSIKNNSIDVIKCDGVLHHIENTEHVLREFHRILKKNGKINCMVYNKKSIWYYLHACYELKIRRGFLYDKTDDEAFKMSTDGFRCPISKCYSEEEFKKLCKKNNFKAELVDISVSKFELGKLNLISEAISDERLDNDKIDFLKKIRIKNNIPFYNNRVAGINAYFELKKTGSFE